jgi:hydrogenase maturation protease
MIRPERHPGSGRITVLGLGNILLSDEGIGVHAVNAIKERYACPPEVEIVDGGTMGLDLLPIFETSEKVLIIDAVDFGKEPGHVGILEGNQIPSALNSKLSVHHIGLNDVLFAAKLMNDNPPEVYLVGMQPKSLDVGLDMTSEIRVKLDTIIALAVQKLKEWNVECALQSPQKSSP